MPDEDRLRAYEIDADTVRVNDPDPDASDLIVRRLGGTEVPEHTEVYEARKGRRDA